MKEYNEKLNEIGIWTPVDADNIIKFAEHRFRIPYNNQNYRVKDSYRDSYNYANESKMDRVFIVIDVTTHELKFYDENLAQIKDIRIVGGVSND